jgi:hypothetical protein
MNVLPDTRLLFRFLRARRPQPMAGRSSLNLACLTGPLAFTDRPACARGQGCAATYCGESLTSVPIPKFARFIGTPSCQLRVSCSRFARHRRKKRRSPARRPHCIARPTDIKPMPRTLRVGDRARQLNAESHRRECVSRASDQTMTFKRGAAGGARRTKPILVEPRAA